MGGVFFNLSFSSLYPKNAPHGAFAFTSTGWVSNTLTLKPCFAWLAVLRTAKTLTLTPIDFSPFPLTLNPSKLFFLSKRVYMLFLSIVHTEEDIKVENILCIPLFTFISLYLSTYNRYFKHLFSNLCLTLK